MKTCRQALCAMVDQAEIGHSQKTPRRRALHCLVSRLVIGLAAVVGASGLVGAAVHKVGPAGAFSKIQAAIDALPQGQQEIRIQSGFFAENLVVTGLAASADIAISGGWDSTFSAQSNPNETKIDGTGAGRVLTVALNNGSIEVSNLTLLGGRGDLSGAGAEILLDNSARAVLRGLVVRDNEIHSTKSVSGGGLRLIAGASSTLVVEDVSVIDNRVVGPDDYAQGGGIEIFVGGDAHGSVRGLVVKDNRIEADQAHSPGAILTVYGRGQLAVTDSRFEGNTAAPSGAVCGASGLYAALLSDDNSASLILERLVVLSNRSQAPIPLRCKQVSIVSAGHGLSLFRDSVVALGNSGGLVSVGFDGPSQPRFVNLTVAYNLGVGVEIVSDGVIKSTFANGLLFGNGTDVSTGPQHNAVLSTTLVGADPHFVNGPGGDLRLLSTSPALDAGATTPPGGLGSFDLDGNSRVQGAAPDQGAYERQGIGPNPQVCVPNDTTLCLAKGRFRVEVTWQNFQGGSGLGHDVGVGSDDSGLFWFFQSTNWEMLVKVLDACSFADHFWVFGSATTNVGYTLTVTDTKSGDLRSFTNALGTRSPAIIDTESFSRCDL